MCSSILPCRSSWVSIPLSPLSSKVRIFRKRENAFTVPRGTQTPPALSHFWHSHVFNSRWNCSDGRVLVTGLSELSTISAERTAAASLIWKGGCLQIPQALAFSLLELPHSGTDPRALGEQHSSRGLVSGLIWTRICAWQPCPAKRELQ